LSKQLYNLPTSLSSQTCGVSLAFSVIRLYNQNKMSRPFQLYRLQQLDTQIDGMHARLKETESALADDSEVSLSREKLAQTNTELQLARQNLRNAEFETQQQRIKIEQTEATLYGGKVHNPKELKDLENEAAALKRQLSVLEDRQLESMEAEEEASKCQRIIAGELDAALARHQRRSGELNQEKEKLEKDLKRMEEERRVAAGSTPAEDLTVYEQLRQKRRGLAVAKVTDRACAACGSTLNAMLLNAARSPNQLNMCDHCGRILYLG
jgi:predicted  nucleic acid-binding Zn-ribbon protein